MGSGRMSQDTFNPMGIHLPGQPRLDPAELHRQLEQVIKDAPMPFDEGTEPLGGNDLEWIGDASALITMLGDISLIGETQFAINWLTSGRRAAGYQRLVVLLHKARALAKQFARGAGPVAESASVLGVPQAPAAGTRTGHFQGVIARGIAAGEGLARRVVDPTGTAKAADAAALGPGPPGPPSRPAPEPYRAEAVQFSAGGEDRPEVLHEILLARVAVLEVAVQELRKPGIGHNKPPADENSFLPVTSDDLDEIDRLVDLLKNQPSVPAAVPPQLTTQIRVVTQIGSKIAELADIYAKEAVKAAGQETGKRLVQLPFWLGIGGAISGVALALQAWLAVLPH